MTANKSDLIRTGIADTIKQIAAPFRKIVLVTDMTGPGSILTECVLASESSLLRQKRCADDALKIDSKNKKRAFTPFADSLNRFAGPNVEIIRPIDTMCRETECLSRVNGEFIWMDYSHIRRNLTTETNRELAHILGIDGILH